MNLYARKNYSWVVLTFSAFFLFYKYVLQVSPSVMTNELMNHFHLDALGLGNLTAMYFYTYGIMQLVAGPLLDIFNVRKLTSLAILVAGLGTIVFSISNQFWLACLGRACIGIGAAFATVSYLKIASQYFAAEKFAFISGLLATAAMLGSMGGEAPLVLLLKNIGWQNTLFYCGLVGILLAVLFFLVITETSNKIANQSHNFNFRDILSVLRKKQNWLLMFYTHRNSRCEYKESIC